MKSVETGGQYINTPGRGGPTTTMTHPEHKHGIAKSDRPPKGMKGICACTGNAQNTHEVAITIQSSMFATCLRKSMIFLLFFLVTHSRKNY
jgi:hypothetical protein